MTVEIHYHCQLLVVHQITVMFKISKNVHFHPLKSFALLEVSDIPYAVKTILLSDVVIY